MRARHVRLLSALTSAAFFLTFSPRAQGGAADIPSWHPPKTGIGYEVDLDAPPETRPEPIRSLEVRSGGPQPLYVRILFSWQQVETEPGNLNFDEVEQAVTRYREAGFEVVLAPRGGHPLYGQATLPVPSQTEYLSAWKAFLRKTGEAFRGRVRFYQVADGPDVSGALPEGAGAREVAFLIKNGAVEIRGADPDARIVLGSVGVSHLDFLEAVLREDLGAYLDAVSLRGEEGVDPAPALGRAQELLFRYDPSASLWLVGQPLPEPPAGGGAAPVETAPSTVPETQPSPTAPSAVPAQTDVPLRGNALIRDYSAALAAGARLTLFALRRGAAGPPELASVTVLLRRLFVPALGVSSEGTAKIRFVSDPGGETVPVEAWRFFDASTFQVLLVYSPRERVGEGARIRITLDTADVTGAVVDDLLANTEKPVDKMESDAASRLTRMTLPLGDGPLLLRYQRFATPGFVKKPEAVEVTGKREITADEIIAHHQEFQADQDRRLQNLSATGRISYHYKVANTDLTVDVTTLNNFTWDRKGGAEWEQREFYFNGVRWKGRKPPELPLIQPEKVVVLPLNINLNKDYSYRLVGTDTVEGRECYVLEFTPVVTGKSLYQGKVWIDRRSFAKVRVTSVQTGLTPPILSNDERDTYGIAPGSGLHPIWVLQRIEGQQIFATGGVNLVVLREIEFSGFALNSPDFEQRRAASYATDHTILRDTEKGFRYLDRDSSGGRVVRESATRSTTLGLLGVFYEKDLDFPLPLAGIDYFDFNFRSHKSQVNVLFAGALLQASIQNPNLFGVRLDAGASAFGIAFSGSDNYYRGDEKLDEMVVRTRTQSLSGNVGYPLGNFFKVKASGSLDFAQYGGDADTSDLFIVPRDTTETSLEVEGEFNRSGYTVQATASRARRSQWDPWGDADPASTAIGTRLADFDPAQRGYRRIRALASKQFILPLFQKVTVRGQYLSGEEMDRFSKYRFSFFGTRVQGFSGSGVRFDRGGILSAIYSFNIAEAVRFEATLSRARVRDAQIGRLDPSLGGDRDFTGFGLAGNFMGPWNTIIQFDYGIAVQSDIPGLRGDQEIEFLLLKFF